MSKGYGVIEGEDFHSVYIKIVNSLITNGEIIWKTKEALFLTFALYNPLDNLVYQRKNWKWCFVELLDRLNGKNPGLAFNFRPRWKVKLEKEGGSFCYSYGEHFSEQIPQIIPAIKRTFDREAIITVWDKRYLDRTHYPRRPCTLSLHFYNRSGKLHLFVSMRSSDIVNLLPYDVFHHTSLQVYLASILGLELGVYHQTTSQYYWPKRRETRNYGERLLEALDKRDYPPLGVLKPHFPWTHPTESIENSHRLLELSINGHKVEDVDSNVPDPYFQSLLYFINN